MVQLSIYFPKQVAIDNPRLWALQNCCGCLTALVVLVMLVYTKVGYVNTVVPDSLITAWVNTPTVEYPTAVQTGHRYWAGKSSVSKMQTHIANGAYNFQATAPYSYTFQNPALAPPCSSSDGQGSHSTLGSCIMKDFPYLVAKGESIESRFKEETLFIPTAYVEDIYMPGTNFANCPLSNKMTGDSTLCKSTNSYLVPGIEHFRIQFFHHYAVHPPASAFHRVFKIDRSIKGSLGVTLRDANDNRIAEFSEEEIVNVTLQNLLAPLGIDLDADTSLLTNADTTAGAAAGIRTRVAGTQITLNADYRNHMFVRGPVCDIEVTGQPALVGVTKSEIIDDKGSTRTRTYSGVRVRFIRKGSFEYFQLSEMIFSVTTFIVWIRLPGFAVFYFAVFFLGTLSKIYTRFLYEDLNLNSEFNGVSSRLLKRAHGFSDLHDLVQADGTRAISLATVKKRMARILAGRRELDEAERDFFTSFFFSKTATAIGENGELAILMEDYLKAVTGEENLRYDDIMRFVDLDSKKSSNCLEALFQDASLKKFMRQASARREIALQQEEEDKKLLDAEGGKKEGEDSGSEEGRGSAYEKRSSQGKMSKNKSGAAEKQSFMLQNRVAGQRLSLQLDKLEKELEAVRQMNDKVQGRHNDFLHYLAFLNDQTQELNRDSMAKGSKQP
jgi:hypothetical protein